MAKATPGLKEASSGRPASIKKALRRALSRPTTDGRRKLDDWADSIVEATTDPRERRAILESLGEIGASNFPRPAAAQGGEGATDPEARPPAEVSAAAV